jgi:putative spermidine/putrescine transport system permease protein
MNSVGKIGRGGIGILLFALYLFLLAPLIIVLIISFDTRPYLSFPPQSFSFDSYVAVMGNAAFAKAFGVSMISDLVATAVALMVGVPVAFVLVGQRFRGSRALIALFLSPLLLPHIALAVGALFILASLGLVDTYVGLITMHVGITLPYIVRTAMLSLSSVDPFCEEAASVHGASPLRRFRRVTLPLAMPGIVAGGVMGFLVSFDEAVIALFITSDKVRTLPVEIFMYIEQRTDPQVAALSVLLILGSILLMLLIENVMGLQRVLKKA